MGHRGTARGAQLAARIALLPAADEDDRLELRDFRVADEAEVGNVRTTGHQLTDWMSRSTVAAPTSGLFSGSL